MTSGVAPADPDNPACAAAPAAPASASTSPSRNGPAPAAWCPKAWHGAAGCSQP